MSLGFLYSALFHMTLRDYLPFLALSQVLWGFLATLVSEACAAFTDAEPVIRSVRMPFFVFAMRILVRNVLVLAHNICVIVVVFASSHLAGRGGSDGDPGAADLGRRRPGAVAASGRHSAPASATSSRSSTASCRSRSSFRR